MVQQEAVVVRNAVKRYGKELVFNGLNMTVSRGSIYGLLGSSGCGKTTLLSCIVGVRYLDSGEIWILGGNPGSKGSGIPGSRVGYMPQGVSLVGEFSVSGAFYYFGRINGLDDEEIEMRQKFFSKLLQLPPADRLVKNMSEGQQRRVSLAVTLIHKPELLILDEPTVGLNPILREIRKCLDVLFLRRIWDYMIQITQEENITVLITTHYIEETKDANKIGLIKCGKLLAESAPQELLEQFQCSSLEETFLKLCNIQNNTVTLNEAQEGENTSSDVLYKDQNQCELTKTMSKYEAVSEHQVSRLRRFKALLVKNGIQFLRHYTGLVFAIIFPILQFGIFVMAIGNNPKNLKIGVVNDKVNNCSLDSNFGNVWTDEITCHFNNLSCRFLLQINNISRIIILREYYDDIHEATYAVQNGKLNGLMYFSPNFSEALQIRMEDATSAKDSDLLASQIQVFLDMGAEELINRLSKQAVIFGHPYQIVSDRGTAFTSKSFKKYCANEKIEHILIATGVPRGNGQVERINRIVIPVLTKLSAPHPETWYKFVDRVQQYINSSMSRSTGLSPFELLIGKNMRLKDDLELKQIIEDETILLLQEKRETLREQAKIAIEKVQKENQRVYNRKRKRPNTYSIGDLVAIKRTQITPGSKLYPKYLGPYQIIHVLRGDRYVVSKVGEHEGPRSTTTSSDNIKRWLVNECDSNVDTSGEDTDNEDGHQGPMPLQNGRDVGPTENV
ncbi:ABCGN protein, partial [Pseudoatta argentina]